MLVMMMRLLMAHDDEDVLTIFILFFPLATFRYYPLPSFLFPSYYGGP